MPRFCTAIHNGCPCPYRARPGVAFCWAHSPQPWLYRQCAFFTRSGRRCRSAAMRGHDHCFTHSPRNRRARQPAIPVLPRTRRQTAQARPCAFSDLPQS